MDRPFKANDGITVAGVADAIFEGNLVEGMAKEPSDFCIVRIDKKTYEQHRDDLVTAGCKLINPHAVKSHLMKVPLLKVEAADGQAGKANRRARQKVGS